MSEELIVNRVRSSTLADLPGRSMNSAREHHFVIDEPAYNGGPGEAVTPAEAFLSGISACGVLLVQNFARRAGIAVRRVECAIEGVRLRAQPANFQRIDLRFEMAGVSQAQAEELVEAYKGR